MSRPSDTEILRVVSYLTKHYGSGRAYDTIQGITLRPSTIPQRLWVGGGKSRPEELRSGVERPGAEIRCVGMVIGRLLKKYPVWL